MKLTVIGTGYVGLVTGACFAEMGNSVTCVDIDEAKIDRIKNGQIPIYEPGLEDVVNNNYKAGRLNFMTTLDDPLAKSSVYMIAVGTPPGEDGSADLQHVLDVARDIGDVIDGYTIVVNKSTVPVGTADLVREMIENQLKKRKVEVEFDVVSNPEFLKEGAAVEDFMRPDRIIIGTGSERAKKILRELYEPFTHSHERVLFMGVRDAEMTKYAANTMLATKISFINEIANLCDRMGVDVENVRRGIGSDSRIGYSFIYPGAGYGGSCFPKDVKALIHIAEKHDFDPKVLKAVESRNQEQKNILFQKINDKFRGGLGDKTFAIWGLAFKPGTDDMREAPSLVLIESLINAGAKIKAFDPVAMASARREANDDWIETGKLTFVEDQYQAVEDVDALVLMTEWKPFRKPDFDLLREKMKTPTIFDGRNQYDPSRLKDLGFEYFGIGR